MSLGVSKTGSANAVSTHNCMFCVEIRRLKLFFDTSKCHLSKTGRLPKETPRKLRKLLERIVLVIRADEIRIELAELDLAAGDLVADDLGTICITTLVVNVSHGKIVTVVQRLHLDV